VDAFLKVSDPLVDNHYQLIIDTATVNRLPTMFDVQSHISKEASPYSVSFHEVGRL
jgi:hypothetical protein